MFPDSTSLPPYPSPTPSPTHQDLADLLRSPTIPQSPAPAYSALPYRDIEFHCAPLLNGRPGDIELETTDGKRFLVHKKILEQETVFFHIYYGFIPVWRLNGNPANGPPHPAIPSSITNYSSTTTSPFSSPTHNTNPTQTQTQTTSTILNPLLCLPKFITSLRSTPSLPPSTQPPPPPPKDNHHHLTQPPSAPTPTTSPYTWTVPESSLILHAFLSLIYPPGTFTPTPTSPLTSPEITSKVIRASLGYQSSKALTLARDKLSEWVETRPVEVYAMACFFKFGDLAKVASGWAVCVDRAVWGNGVESLMGKSGFGKLEELRRVRIEGLRGILGGGVEVDEHTSGCVRRGMIEGLWEKKLESVKDGLKVDSDLLELLEVDLRGGHCGDCLVNLGKTIQRCLLEAKGLPKTIRVG